MDKGMQYGSLAELIREYTVSYVSFEEASTKPF